MNNSEDKKNIFIKPSVHSIDQHLLFIAQKVEKITIALYIITDFLKDNEPFKWELREKAIRLLTFINSFKGLHTAAEKEQAISDTLPLFSEVLSLLRFGVAIRFISHMNYSVLKDEYDSLYDTLNDRLNMRQPVDGIIIPQDFFEIQSDRSHIGQKEDKGHKEMSFIKNTELLSDKPSEDMSFKENNTENNKENKNVLLNADDFESKKGMRKDVILRLLRTKNKVSIKDISNVVLGCSEKTIQRELAALVEEGLVRKTGERRWSTYELVNKA